MSIGPKPRYNPCIAMYMLVDGALRELEQQTKFRNTYFNAVFRMFEHMRYIPEISPALKLNHNEEYEYIAIAFNLSRPQNIDKIQFINSSQAICKLLGIPSPFTVDDEELEQFKIFLDTFSKELKIHSKVCEEFE